MKEDIDNNIRNILSEVKNIKYVINWINSSKSDEDILRIKEPFDRARIIELIKAREEIDKIKEEVGK